MRNYNLETLQLHVGQEKPNPVNAGTASICATTSYVFKDYARPAERFGLTESSIYARWMNPALHIKPVKAIAMGVSTGGPKSLAEMLPKLCSMTTLPILLVQHMPPNFTKLLADSLDKKCSHKVVEGLSGTVIQDKTIYIAPGGYHMTVRTRGSDFVLENNQDPPENGCRPSVDVLFRSMAQFYPNDSVIGVILTGMGKDGTPSLPHLKNKNAYLIAQDEDTSVVFGMPRAAAETGLLNKVAPLMHIPEAVVRRINMGIDTK